MAIKIPGDPEDLFRALTTLARAAQAAGGQVVFRLAEATEEIDDSSSPVRPPARAFVELRVEAGGNAPSPADGGSALDPPEVADLALQWDGRFQRLPAVEGRVVYRLLLPQGS